jgi:peptidoglycan/LPS O-acetylase OafA/YrhL
MSAKDSGYTFVGMPREMVLYNGKEIPRILIWGIPSFIVLISYFALASKYKITNAYLSKLGDRSYSIYLLQIFFIYLLYEVSHKFGRSEKIWLSMAMIIALAWISGYSYKYFEKRFHR